MWLSRAVRTCLCVQAPLPARYPGFGRCLSESLFILPGGLLTHGPRLGFLDTSHYEAYKAYAGVC